MVIWALDSLLNEFRTLHFADVVAGKKRGTLDFTYSFHGNKPLSTTWSPPHVVYYERDKPEGDFPYFWGADCPVFTARSLSVLGDIIAPFGECLPLRSEDGEFMAFKVLHFIDALDTKLSEIKWFPQLKRELGQPKHVEKIKRYVFCEEILRKAVIFRIPQLPLDQIFVTDVFVNRVQEAGLTGFAFNQVWPQPGPAISARTKRALETRRKKRSPSATDKK